MVARALCSGRAACRILRLRRADGLRLPPTGRKVARRGISTGLPNKAVRRGHVWTWDFISDATVRGGAPKLLTILDEHTRECQVLLPKCAWRAADVLVWLERAIKKHGAPAFLRSDNGPGVVADFRHHYNHSRPHGKLGYQSPVRFAAQNTRPPARVEAGQNHPTQLHTEHISG